MLHDIFGSTLESAGSVAIQALGEMNLAHHFLYEEAVLDL
jgi:hypothetical protein